MQAVVKEKKGPGFATKETAKPRPRDNEVLVSVKAVGICGSDIPILDGIRPVPLPFIPGHEFSGVIEEVGSNVKMFRLGDRVTSGLVIHCGECLSCRRGHESLCDHIIETGIHTNGAFAEYVCVPEQTLHQLPKDMSFTKGASIDPAASAYRPVKKASVGSEDTVVVFGPGPIGMYAAQMAKVEGARRVVLVGIPGDEGRLTLARSLGIDDTVVYEEERFFDEIDDLLEDERADIVIEATGSAQVFNLCIQTLRKGGKCLAAGIVHELSSLDFGIIVRNEISLEGSICYTRKEFSECLSLVQEGRIKVEPLITHKLPLAEISRGINLIKSKEAMKVMLYPKEIDEQYMEGEG